MPKYFTCRQLATLALPGYPGTSQGWDKLVKARGWECIEVRSRGRGGIRHEYIPPPEVMTLIEARQRGEALPEPPRRAVAAPAPVAIPPSTLQPQRHEAVSPVASYASAVAAPAPEMKDEWLAVALDALDYAIKPDGDAYVTPLNKAKMVKKLLALVAFHASQEGETLNSIEIGILVRSYAELLADRLPKVNINNG